MKLDRHSSLPLYYQLKEFITKKIESGEYVRGEKIPSELEFCQELDLSRPTVRQAVAELVTEGKLQIIKGKGTFVTSKVKSIDIPDFGYSTFSFFSQKRADKSEIIDKGLLFSEISDDIREMFKDPSLLRDGVYYVDRLLGYEEIPYAYIRTFIPACLFPNLLEDIENEKSMVDITANKYAYIPVKGKCSIEVSPVDNEAMPLLDIARGTSVISIRSISLSRSGAVCETVVAQLRSDICKLIL